MKIYNDANNLLGQYCGDETGHTVQITGQYAKLEFRTDINKINRGFHMVFTTVPLGE